MTPGEGNILAMDQLVFLQRKRKTGANIFRVLKPGETIYDISQQEGIRYENILELNHLLAGSEPAEGEKIYLREKAPARPLLAGAARPLQAQPAIAAQVSNETETSAAATITTAKRTTHVVRSKETLYGISKRYGVSQEQIREWNKLVGVSLRTGQELIIYTN